VTRPVTQPVMQKDAMRMSPSLLLCLIALAAAGVWAFGAFGGGAGAMMEARTAFVREPLPADAASPAAAPGQAPSRAPEADPPAAPTQTPEAGPAAPTVNPFSTLRTPDTAEPQNLPAGPAAPASTPVAPLSPASPGAVGRPDAQAAAAPASLGAEFRSRRLTYNRPPQTLFLDRAIDVALIIDTSRSADAAGRLQGLPGEIVTRDVDLADTVAAELLGAAFDIELQTTSTRQKLSARLANEWRWRVTPKQKGVHTLQLNVYGYAVGSLDAEPLDSFRDEITVTVEPVDEVLAFARQVQPLAAVIAALAGVGSVAMAFLRLREERRRTRPAGQPDSPTQDKPTDGPAV